jgi:hypothetical protein
MRQQGNGAINEFNERVEIAAIRESLSLASGAAPFLRARRAGRLPPASRRRDVANYRAVLIFTGSFTTSTPSFVTANARSKEQECLFRAEPAIRCDNSALYVTERVWHFNLGNTWLR